MRSKLIIVSIHVVEVHVVKRSDHGGLRQLQNSLLHELQLHEYSLSSTWME